MTKKLNLNEVPIGNLIVYDEQVECGDRIIAEFNLHKGPPVLNAQAQQGKTGTCIYVVDKLVKHWEHTGESYEIFYIVNLADNELKSQTVERLTEAWLDETTNPRIKVIHHKNLSGVQPDLSVKYRLIIVDECHLALGKNRPLDNFLKRCGITYGRPITEWENTNNFVLSVSATPFAQVMKAFYDGHCFSLVPLGVSEHYYGIMDAHLNERFKKSEPVVEDGKVTPYYEERLSEFLDVCEDFGNGYQVLRTQGIRPEIVENYIGETYGQSVSVRSYSHEEKNLSKLDGQLKIRPPKPTVVIIRGALRVGKTLSTTKNIRQWIEPFNSNPDTTYQAIGRCFGYMSEDGHSKFNDTFLIHCNTKAINRIIQFYANSQCIPKTRWNNSSVKRIKRYQMEIVDNVNDIPSGIPEGMNTISGNEKNDLAKAILRGNIRSGELRRVYIDRPNKKHQASWDILEAAKPEWIGKYAYFIPLDKPEYELDFNGLHPAACINN